MKVRDTESRADRWGRTAWRAAIALAAALTGACETPPSQERARNVVLITIDTLRADALGFAGQPQAATPVLDRLAAEGRVFSNAHAHAVTTLPSHASILTGRLPYEHGVRHNGGYVLEPTVPTLGTLLRNEGFETAAFVGAYPLDRRFGLGQGFDIYDDVGRQPQSIFETSERPATEVVGKAVTWWESKGDARKFLWIHLFEPHAPYLPPEPFRSRFEADPYHGEVAAADAALSGLLSRILKESGKTIVVFTSDHGESLGQHGEDTHGLFAYEPTLRVPLVLWGAGVEAGTDDRSARHVDLLPTVLDAVGAEAAEDLPGISLLDLDARPGPSFFEALSPHLDYGWAPLRGVVADGRKLIELPLPELYDLGSDPDEGNNLHGTESKVSAKLSRHLPADEVWRPEQLGEVPVDVRLRSLGYIGGPTLLRSDFGPEDDPKSLMHLDRRLADVARLSEAGRLDDAIAGAKEIVDARPSMGVAYIYLSSLLIERGDVEEAIGFIDRARAEGVAGPELLEQLGLALLRLGKPTEALAILEPLSGAEGATTAGNHRALALTDLGRFEEAERALLRLRDLDPEEGRTHENLSYLEIRRGRHTAAAEHAARAVDLDPELVSSWNNLGIAFFYDERSADAIDAWQNGLAVEAQNADILFNLGSVEASLGRTEDALNTLRSFLSAARGSAFDDRRSQAEALVRDLEAR